MAVKKDTKRLVILDTHAILHRAYHALPEFSSSKGEPTGALYGLLSMLVKIINDLRPDYIAAAVDLPGATFREAAYADYKGTRVKTDDALIAQIKKTPDVLRAFGVPVYFAETFEADDIIGTIVEQVKKKKDLEVIIATGDKDALQLIEGTRVTVFTLGKGMNDTVMYDEDRVKERYGFGPAGVIDLKGIAGDPSDNIKGVPGVGEGSALKLLQKYGSLKNIYAAIKKDGIEKVSEATAVQKRFVQLVADNKKEAEFSKLLATIRRDVPIEFEMPTKSWKETADTKKALDMLAEFEFRGLLPRVKTILGVAAEQGSTGQNSLVETEMTRGLFGKEIPAEAFNKASIAVSVLDSTIAEPTMDDIVRMGKSEDFDTALKNLEKDIQENKLEFVYEKIELPLAPVLRGMEKRGIKVDKAFLKKLSQEYSKELEKISKQIYKHAGGEFNVGSPKQLGEILFDKLGLETKKKTAGGQRSTRESELQKLVGVHPIIEDILSYRELSKLLSTYIDALPTLLDKNDRVHTRFVQVGAATGRMASWDPNLQNIPIKSDLGRAIRHAFVADKGFKLVSFDYSQIELRLAAILSGDEGLQEIFKEGRDVHTEVAARVFGVSAHNVDYEQRRRAKVINFGLLYGMGVSALQQSLGTNRKDAQEFYNQYLAAFPRLAAYLEEVKADAARIGYTETLFGRRRYMDGIHSSIPYVRAAAERMAINAPLQGTSADLIKLAMIEIDKEFPGILLLQVHDELVFEIKDNKVGEFAPKLKAIMESVVPKKDAKGVPITVEGKAGDNWGEMEKI
ncbi:MAG: DNA polymerase [Patescibacteria group bacterium]